MLVMTKYTHLLCYSLMCFVFLARKLECFQPPSGLEAKLAKATLPIGLSYFSSQAVFDGTDSIYVIGGLHEELTPLGRLERKGHCTIFKYSISFDEINCVANLTEMTDGGGTASLGKNGRIYFSSRQNGPFDVYEFDPTTNQVRGMNVPTPTTGYMYSAVTNSGSLILMDWRGGNTTTVYEWHINATTCRTVGRLPFNKWGGSIHYLSETDKMLIVGSYVESRTMALFDIKTGETEILPNLLWDIISGTDVVIKGELFRFGRIDGGITNKFLWYADDHSTEHHQKMVDIRNIPYNGLFYSHTGVYVEPLNRLYVFGGFINSNSSYAKDIWYVDLSPVPYEPVTEIDTPTLIKIVNGIWL